MKNIFKLLFVALCTITFTNCKKPTDGLKINFQANVFDYLATIQFYDVANPSKVLSDINITVSGTNAEYIYEIGGTKNFKVTGNLITLGLHKVVKPAPGQPITFDLLITADGYLNTRKTITMVDGQMQQLVTIPMVNTATPPKGGSVAKQDVTLTGGVTTTVTNIATPLTGGKQESTSISLPAGTSFKNAAGVTLTGGTLSVTSMHFDTRNAASQNAFPGGYTSSAIKDASGNIVSGYFTSAGFTNIDMSVGGEDVKGFNQPINLATSIDPTTFNPATGTTVAVGDIIPIWAFRVETGQWEFQQNATLALVGGKMVVNYQTDHLTWFNLGWMSSTCASGSMTFNIPGVSTSEPYLIDVFAGTTTTVRPIVTQVSTVGNGDVLNFANIPEGDITVKVYRSDASSDPTNYTMRGTLLGSTTATVCGASTSITLSVPTATPIVFDLTGVCSNGVRVRPTADVFYRLSGSGASYILLGTVRAGTFTTTNLELGKTYDFKSVYKSKTYAITRLVDSTSYKGDRTMPVSFEGDFCN